MNRSSVLELTKPARVSLRELHEPGIEQELPISSCVARENFPEQGEKISCAMFSSALPPSSAFFAFSLQVVREIG
jgi:hypothetical protein